METFSEEIRRELSLGEQVRWWGRPRQGLVLRATDAFVIPFSLLWCGFAVFWELSVMRAPNAPAFFVLWGIPFVAIGIYFVIGRFFVEAKQRSRTFYAVTNERILIVSGLFGRKVKSLKLRTLSDISLSERSSGEGSISFGPQPPFASTFGGFAGWPGAEQLTGPRFDLVQNAKSVYEIIRNAQRS